MSAGFAESDAEEAALGWLETLGYTVKHGPEIAYNVDGGERTDEGYRDTILQNRLHRALTRLNPGLPTATVFDAYRKLLRVERPNLLARNRALHRMLADGVNVEYARSDGSIAGAQAQVIDFDRPEQNDWLAVNQFTVVEGQQSRRADIVIFVNGLALGVIELKNPADEGATVWDAVQQLENYQTLIPALFTYNAALIASDGVQARIGALGAGKEWFKPWRTISGREAGPSRTAGRARRRVPAAPVPRSHSPFHCVRGSRRRARGEDRGIPSIPRGQCRGGRDVAGRQSRARGRGGGRNLFCAP